MSARSPGLESTDVSTTVESDRFLGVERSMTWGAVADAIYGSHAETATPSPSTTWFLAEGSTVLGFDLFYLLQNPQATTRHATVNFLLPSGTPISRTYTLAPGSRTTIYVNQVAGPRRDRRLRRRSAPTRRLSWSGRCTAACPASRSRSGPTRWACRRRRRRWFLAEGATGAFFDLFVLIANPGARTPP